MRHYSASIFGIVPVLCLVLVAACSPAANNENGRVPGGTNQQEAVNAAPDSGASDTMPGIGAPGAGGNGTQP